MDTATRLDFFLDVVQQGSFAKAANLRNIDRSALSKQIKILEDDLGIRLLNRSTRSLSLTDAGNEVLKRAESVRELLADTQRVAESFHASPKGSLRITSSALFGRMYVQKAVNIFMEKYPDTNIKLVLDDRRADIIGDRFDLAFRIGPPRDSNLIAKKLADTKAAILASEGFVEKYGKPVTPEELIKLPSVIYDNGQYTLNRINVAESPNNNIIRTHTVKGNYEVNDVSALIDALRAGLGYSVRGLFTLDRNIKELGLVPLLTDHKLSVGDWGIYAVYPHRNQTPIVKLFIETVQELIGSPPIWESYIDGYNQMYK